MMMMMMTDDDDELDNVEWYCKETDIGRELYLGMDRSFGLTLIFLSSWAQALGGYGVAMIAVDRFWACTFPVAYKKVRASDGSSTYLLYVHFGGWSR